MKNNILISILPIAVVLLLTSCGSREQTSEPLDTEINQDYSKYLNLIWCPESNDSDVYYPCFRLTEISEDNVKGYIGTCSEVMPQCFINSFEPVKYNEFSGKFENGKAVCIFELGSEKLSGTLNIEFAENELETEIEFDKTESDSNYKTPITGIYTPYNVYDQSYIINTVSIGAELNSWGKVNITTVYMNQEHPWSEAFITDDSGNILYEFEALINGVEPKSITTADYNKDGLTDVNISMEFELEYPYIQTENGLFYGCWLDPDPEIAELAKLPS